VFVLAILLVVIVVIAAADLGWRWFHRQQRADAHGLQE